MNKPLLVLASVLSVMALSAGSAAAVESGGYELYQRHVQGHDSGPATTPTPVSTMAYGPYATYRIVNGASPQEALADAGAIGEMQPVVMPAFPQVALTGYDAYRRNVLGHDLNEIVETHSGAVSTTVAQVR